MPPNIYVHEVCKLNSNADFRCQFTAFHELDLAICAGPLCHCCLEFAEQQEIATLVEILLSFHFIVTALYVLRVFNASRSALLAWSVIVLGLLYALLCKGSVSCTCLFFLLAVSITDLCLLICVHLLGKHAE